MRCPQCNKFVPMELQEPEEQGDVEIDGGHVTVQVRIVRTCEECGTELKDTTLDLETDVDIPEGHEGEGHELEVVDVSYDTIEEGGGRYKKSYFGATCTFSVRCSCQDSKDEPLIKDATMEDKIAASAMDECC